MTKRELAKKWIDFIEEDPYKLYDYTDSFVMYSMTFADEETSGWVTYDLNKELLIYQIYAKDKHIEDYETVSLQGIYHLLDISKDTYEVASLYSFHDKLMKLYRKLDESINENIEDRLEVHDILNPALWDKDYNLKKEVKEKIELIVEKFIENLKEDEIDIKPIDILILGSNANFNYNKDSDIDVHILTDTSILPNHEKLLLAIYNAYKKLWNDKYDITFNGYEVELYVEGEYTTAHSGGVYSLNKGWLSKPIRQSIPDIDKEELEDSILDWEEEYNKVIKSNSIDKLNSYIDGLYLMRQSAIDKDGEYSIGNLVFKEIRASGKLQSIKDKIVELEEKKLSIK